MSRPDPKVYTICEAVSFRTRVQCAKAYAEQYLLGIAARRPLGQ
jgi:hypothetical protein